MQKLFVSISSRFWWFRGVAAAFALLGFVPSVLPLERIEFLRLTYALVVGWQRIAAFAGKLLGEVLFLPSLTSSEVNAVILVFAFMLPAAYALGRAIDSADEIYEDASLLRRWIFRISVDRTGRVEGIGAVVSAAVMGMALSRVADGSAGRASTAIAAIAIIVIAMLQISVQFPRYAKGIVTVVSTVATLQVLYFLHLPILSDFLNEFACSIAPDC